MPADRDALLRLPGVGPATAGALLAFAFARPAVFIETNIRRVFLHQYFPAATTVPDAALLPLVARTLDRRQPRRWYYALMDWGAALGQQRAGNPNRRSAHYSRQSPFAGSRRELRGRVLRLLAERRCLTFAELQDRCADDRLATVVACISADLLHWSPNGSWSAPAHWSGSPGIRRHPAPPRAARTRANSLGKMH